MLGAIAQFETELRAERQMDGIRLAKARGVVFGHRKQLSPDRIAELRERREQGSADPHADGGLSHFQSKRVPLTEGGCRTIGSRHARRRQWETVVMGR